MQAWKENTDNNKWVKENITLQKKPISRLSRLVFVILSDIDVVPREQSADTKSKTKTVKSIYDFIKTV